MKKHYYLLASLLVLLLAAPVGAQQWVVGPDSTVTVTLANGVLTVSGSGAMSDYEQPRDVPWKGYTINRVVIGDSITHVGNTSFYDYESLSSVYLGRSLQSVGRLAFGVCSSLESIHFNSTGVSLGYSAFINCGLKDTLDLTGVTSMDMDVFERNYSLTHVYAPDLVGGVLTGSFNDCSSLVYVSLPLLHKVKRLFNSCSALQTVECLAADTFIDNSFYGCTALTTVNAPNLRYVGENVFRNCSSLQSIDFPVLEWVDEHGFRGCSAVTELTLPATLTNVASYGFGDMSSLHKIICNAPATADIYQCMAWSGCYAIDTIVANTEFVVQPCVNFDDVVVLPLNDAVRDAYARAGYYFEEHDTTFNFLVMDPLLITVADVPQWQNRSLLLDFSAIDTARVGRLTVDAGANIQLSHFRKCDYMGLENTWSKWNQEMQWNPENPNPNYNRGYDFVQTALINNGSLTADTVDMLEEFSHNDWYFTSLPFTMKVSDIQLPQNTYMAIRRFDPAQQALGNDDDAWVNLQPTDTIHANQGFIFRTTYASDNINSQSTKLLFTAMDDDKKQNMFRSADQALALQHTAAAKPWNANWNLLANPYASFYNTNGMAQGVIGVYVNGGSSKTYGGYSFYSLTDDYYVMQPFESFFYQAKAEESMLNFQAANRRMTARPDSLTIISAYEAPARATRAIYNVILENDTYADRCRLVFNPAASFDYEVGVDAPKLLTGREQLALSSTMGEARLAINERPLGDGLVYLNAKFAEAGTYTLRLQDAEDVQLTDLLTGVTTDLSTSAYTFTTAAGDYADRFVLGFTTGTTDLESVQTQEGGVTAIYNLAGQRMAPGRSLPAGIYIIRRGNQSQKVIF